MLAPCPVPGHEERARAPCCHTAGIAVRPGQLPVAPAPGVRLPLAFALQAPWSLAESTAALRLCLRLPAREQSKMQASPSRCEASCAWSDAACLHCAVPRRARTHAPHARLLPRPRPGSPIAALPVELLSAYALQRGETGGPQGLARPSRSLESGVDNSVLGIKLKTSTSAPAALSPRPLWCNQPGRGMCE